MIDLASALTLPLAKLLLKSWLGDTAADIGDNLFRLALNRLGDRTKARAAQQRANEITKGVVSDLSRFLANERDEDGLYAAAFELGETIGRHVDACFRTAPLTGRGQTGEVGHGGAGGEQAGKSGGQTEQVPEPGNAALLQCHGQR